MTPPVVGCMVALGVVVLMGACHRVLVEIRSNRVRKRLGYGSFVTHSTRLTTNEKGFMAGVVAAYSAWIIGGLGLAFIAICAVGLSVWQIALQRKRSFNKTYERQLPVVLDALIMSVRSGASLPVAITEVASELHGPIASDLSDIARRLDLGFGLVPSLKVWSEQRRMEAVRVTVASLSISFESGLPIASSLGSVRETVGFALTRADVARTAAAQARASTFALAGLPVVVSGPMLLLNESARHFMFHTIPGVIILVVGLLLDICGVVWMNRLIERAQR